MMAKPWQLIQGDCLEILRGMTDCSVDAVVTDPPYGLAFMGKRWDYDVPSVEIWAECLRVLKPGGHLLAFAGTRTQHRMAVRIEDAGFEIRDMIAWVYGSGFPKSLDVSKAIDKQDATEARMTRRYRFTEWMVSACALTPKQMDAVCETNTMGRHWTDVLPNGKQPDVPTREHFEKLRPHIAVDVPAWVEQMVDERTVESENFKRREVLVTKKMRDTSEVRIAVTASAADYDASACREVEITSAHTEAARQWQGWGTALKPALEPITVARKPLIGAVAENVLAHGTGALNIDGCRVPTDEQLRPGSGGIPCRHDESTPRGREGEASAQRRYSDRGGTDFAATPGPRGGDPAGRWPANLIHDGSDEVLAAFPLAPGQIADAKRTGERKTANVYGTMRYANGRDGEASASSDNDGAVGFKMKPGARRTDSGSAARFFANFKDYTPCQQPSPAHTAAAPSCLQSALDASVASAAATWASLAGILSSDSPAPSTSVTDSECVTLCECVTAAMASIGSGFSLDSWLEKRTPSESLVSVAARREPTGTTTITASLLTSDGSAARATCSITPTWLDRGDKDCARFSYCAKASRFDRNAGTESLPQRVAGMVSNTSGQHITRRDEGYEQKPQGNHHPTVKPTDLMRYLCRLVTPPGGVVLDPFMGSGSTGKAAVLEGFGFVGIEREAEYVEISLGRLRAAEAEFCGVADLV